MTPASDEGVHHDPAGSQTVERLKCENQLVIGQTVK